MTSKSKARRMDDELETEEVCQKEIDVHTIQLPFFRVYPIYWMDYSEPDRLLAVCRANSTIELWSYPYWHMVSRINLQREVSVRKCFIVRKEGKAAFLVIVTSNSYVITYDLREGEFRQHLLHGGEFAFDADFDHQIEEEQAPALDDQMDDELPSRKSSKFFDSNDDILGRLVLACNDGACRYFEMSERGIFSLKFTSQAKDEKATSCCFSQGLEDAKQSFCVGYESGDIRIFDYRTKQLLTLISGDKSTENKSTIWALKTVAPNFVVSGTSQGAVKIHETKYGTLVKELKEHIADILTITVSEDHTRIYVSGADSQIAIIGKSKQDIGGLDIVEFKVTSKERGQSHDIYCIVELHKDLIISAGNTTDICLYKVDHDRFIDRKLGGGNKIKLRHITSVNAGQQVEYNSKSELLVLNNFKSVDVFAFQPGSSTMDYIANITIDEFSTRFISVSQVASYFAIASAGKLEIFSFHKKRRTLARITTEFSESTCKALAFAGQLLFFVTEDDPSIIQIYNLATSKLAKHEFEKLGSIKKIDIFKVSQDGDRLVIADKLNHKMMLFGIQTQKTHDLSGYRKARVMDASMCKSTFSVFVVYETNTLLKINSSGKVVYFSGGKLPQDFSKLHDRYFGALSHPTDKKKVLLYSLYSFTRIDTSVQYDEIEKTKDHEVLMPEGGSETETKPSQLRVVRSSKPIAGIHMAKAGLIVVYFDWKKAMSEIPDPVITKKFGQ